VSCAPLRSPLEILEDRSDAVLIGADLYLRPWIVGEPGVLGFDADEVRVAGADAVPVALSRTVAMACGDDVVGAVPLRI
jgi:hypothetical protein